MNEMDAIHPLNNDFGNYEDSLILTIAQQGNHGNAIVYQNYEVQYTPETGFYGYDTVLYQVCFESIPEICDIGSIFFYVSPYFPVAYDDLDSVNMNDSVTVNVLENDENSGMFDLVATIERGALHGTQTIEDSNIIYTPDTDFSGTDSLEYRISNVNDADIYDIGKLVINVLYVSSIDQNDNITGIKVFPNPGHDFIKIEFKMKSSEEISIEIADMTGKLVYKTKMLVHTGKNVIPVNLNNHTGIYLLKIFTPESVKRQKIILK